MSTKYNIGGKKSEERHQETDQGKGGREGGENVGSHKGGSKRD